MNDNFKYMNKYKNSIKYQQLNFCVVINTIKSYIRQNRLI
jgi:hypothetical protein